MTNLKNCQYPTLEELKVFENSEFGKVRTVVIDNKPYFVGSDIAKALGYSIPSRAVNTHCKGVTKTVVPTNGGVQEVLVIPEGDIYRLIVRSKLPSAERFETWVFDEVLPSIRKHGMYATNELLDNPELLLDIVTRLKEEREARDIAERQIEAMKPKVLFANAVETSNNSILIGQLAKLLNQNNIDIGQNRLFQWLRDNKFLISQKGENWNVPTQKGMDLELFEIKVRTVINPDGTVMNVRTTKVTGKGQVYFVNKFLNI